MPFPAQAAACVLYLVIATPAFTMHPLMTDDAGN